ncbi:MAG: S8 family serine peptidase, partial [Chitinophagaceae bacterium]
LVFYTACKKETARTDSLETETPPDEEVCPAAVTTDNGKIIEGRYIVELKSTNPMRLATERVMIELNKSFLRRQGIDASLLKGSFSGDVNGFVAELSPTQVAKLKLNSEVVAIEPDRVVALGSCFTVVAPSLITWNVIKTGYGDGTSKTAWVVDTGIESDHPDLNVDASRSRSFLTGNTSFEDENGHGTHVAGIIGDRNNTIGVLGVASNATVVSVRVLDKDGEGTGSAIVQALSYISANAKAGDVVNMSLGIDTVSTILDNQVKAIAAKGIYISIAAGNETKAANLTSPARVNATNVYTVSAVDSLNRFASFSNYGNDVVDYAAPGVRIVSSYLDGRYARMSGTSMAAPHVAGLLLLVGNNVKFSGTALNDPDGTPDKIASK